MRLKVKKNNLTTAKFSPVSGFFTAKISLKYDSNLLQPINLRKDTFFCYENTLPVLVKVIISNSTILKSSKRYRRISGRTGRICKTKSGDWLQISIMKGHIQAAEFLYIFQAMMR